MCACVLELWWPCVCEVSFKMALVLLGPGVLLRVMTPCKGTVVSSCGQSLCWPCMGTNNNNISADIANSQIS